MFGGGFKPQVSAQVFQKQGKGRQPPPLANRLKRKNWFNGSAEKVDTA